MYIYISVYIYIYIYIDFISETIRDRAKRMKIWDPQGNIIYIVYNKYILYDIYIYIYIIFIIIYI